MKNNAVNFDELYGSYMKVLNEHRKSLVYGTSDTFKPLAGEIVAKYFAKGFEDLFSDSNDLGNSNQEMSFRLLAEYFRIIFSVNNFGLDEYFQVRDHIEKILVSLKNNKFEDTIDQETNGLDSLKIQAWLNLLRNFEKRDENICVLSTKEEMSDQLGGNAESGTDDSWDEEIFVVVYDIHIMGQDLAVTLQVSFKIGKIATLIMVDCRDTVGDHFNLDINNTPLIKFEDYDTIDCSWDDAYDYLLKCLNYFHDLIPEVTK